MEIMGKLLYVFSRLREPSTHAALSSMFTLLGFNIPPSTWSTVVNGLAVIFGIIAVFVKEGKPESTVKGF